jgi:hypothetical protein
VTRREACHESATYSSRSRHRCGAERPLDASEKPHDISRSRKSARTLPVLLNPFGVSPAAPQNRECWLEPLPSVSSFFLLKLVRMPALTKCLPKTFV